MCAALSRAQSVPPSPLGSHCIFKGGIFIPRPGSVLFKTGVFLKFSCWPKHAQLVSRCKHVQRSGVQPCVLICWQTNCTRGRAQQILPTVHIQTRAVYCSSFYSDTNVCPHSGALQSQSPRLFLLLSGLSLTTELNNKCFKLSTLSQQGLQNYIMVGFVNTKYYISYSAQCDWPICPHCALVVF